MLRIDVGVGGIAFKTYPCSSLKIQIRRNAESEETLV